MAVSTSPDAEGLLSSAEVASALDLPREFAYLRAHGGPGPWRLLAQLLRLRLTGSRFSATDWVDFGLWRRDLSAADRRAFQPKRACRSFNDSLRRRGHPAADAVIEDKVASLARFRDLGLPFVPVAAVYRPGAGDPPPLGQWLRDPAALTGFLSNPAVYPLFGKPLHASKSRGAVAIAGPGAAAGTLRLLDGREAPVAALVAEVAGRFGAGYLFQPKVDNAAALARHLGPATASLRLVTILTGGGAEVLYALHKCPAEGALHDGPARRPRAFALVDAATGIVQSLRRYHDPAGPVLTHWRDAEAPFAGFRLPGYEAAVAAVCAGAAGFPGHGILGWDVFLTDDGPRLSEVNANPHHAIWQTATGRGFYTAEHRARLAPLGAGRFFP